jgi:hypothetical protein
MIRWGKILMLSVLSGLIANAATAQPATERLAIAKRLWAQQEFALAYESLKRYRDFDYGRSFEVDFMLGTCACRMAERRERGAAFLEWVRYTYSDRLTDEGRQVIAAELALCRANTRSPPAPASLPAARQMVTAGAQLQGKTYYYGNRDQPSLTRLARAVPLPQERIRERWIKIGDEQGAMRLAQQAMPGAKTRIYSRFVIISKSNHTDADLIDANRLLERYLDFFVQNYEMRASQDYIFVYLVPSIDHLQELASRHHGMDLSFGTIAYSFRDDLSLAAVIPGRLYGSLFHELFHLTARTNFGDIPTWLDEGIAALYEVSVAADGGFRGVPNWRGKVLERFRNQLPSVRELIRQDNPALADADDRRSREATEELETERAIFAATARYFALYLQERRALYRTYTAVRNFSASEQFTGTAAGVIRLVERSTGRPIDALNADFRGWLFAQIDSPMSNTPRDDRLDKYIPPNAVDPRLDRYIPPRPKQ